MWYQLLFQKIAQHRIKHLEQEAEELHGYLTGKPVLRPNEELIRAALLEAKLDISVIGSPLSKIGENVLITKLQK